MSPDDEREFGDYVVARSGRLCEFAYGSSHEASDHNGQILVGCRWGSHRLSPRASVVIRANVTRGQHGRPLSAIVVSPNIPFAHTVIEDDAKGCVRQRQVGAAHCR